MNAKMSWVHERHSHMPKMLSMQCVACGEQLWDGHMLTKDEIEDMIAMHTAMVDHS